VNAYRISITQQVNSHDLLMRDLSRHNAEVLKQVQALQATVGSLAAGQQQQQAAAVAGLGSFHGGKSAPGPDPGSAAGPSRWPSRRPSVVPARILSTLAGRSSGVGGGRGGGTAGATPPSQVDEADGAAEGGEVTVGSARAAGVTGGVAGVDDDREGSDGPQGSDGDLLAALQQQMEQQQNLIRLLAARLEQVSDRQ
jgi:hypothetical protein